MVRAGFNSVQVKETSKTGQTSFVDFQVPSKSNMADWTTEHYGK